jgi:hypothetical protein
VHPAHGSTVDRPHNPKGMRSRPSTRDLRVVDASKRDAAAVSPESGGARRWLAGATLDHAVGRKNVHR